MLALHCVSLPTLKFLSQNFPNMIPGKVADEWAHLTGVRQLLGSMCPLPQPL